MSKCWRWERGSLDNTLHMLNAAELRTWKYTSSVWCILCYMYFITVRNNFLSKNKQTNLLGWWTLQPSDVREALIHSIFLPCQPLGTLSSLAISPPGLRPLRPLQVSQLHHGDSKQERGRVLAASLFWGWGSSFLEVPCPPLLLPHPADGTGDITCPSPVLSMSNWPWWVQIPGHWGWAKSTWRWWPEQTWGPGMQTQVWPPQQATSTDQDNAHHPF